MPELPEVETMVRGIRPRVTGRRIVAVRKCRCSCKPIDVRPSLRTISRRVRGASVTAVRRLAKRIVLELSTEDSIVIEPRMTGLMLLCDPPDREHLRIEWRFEAGGALPGRVAANSVPENGDWLPDRTLDIREFRSSRVPVPVFGRPANRSTPDTANGTTSLWFWDRRGLGTVRLYSRAQLAEVLGPQRIGPDALALSEADWRERCSLTSRPVKTALLDQKWVAGIGNLYASEILHAARIHPQLPADRLKPRQVGRLAAAVQNVLLAAIRYEGSTLGDGTYRNALNQNGGYQSEHRVYARAGQVCPTCGRGRIRRIVQNQRSTFFCPRCQSGSIIPQPPAV